MTPDHRFTATLAWQMLTRLGEIQILLPVLLATAWSIRRPARRLAASWVGAAAVAVLITAATKVAFIGWGWGSATLDFTGISGHAMMAAAVLPLLLHLALRGRTAGGASAGLAAGTLLALVVAISRLRLGAHSPSEVVAGFLLGATVSAAALATGRAAALRLPLWLPLALLAAVLVAAAGAPPSPAHGWVTRLALAASGRSHPYTRWQMHRDQRQAASGNAAR